MVKVLLHSQSLMIESEELSFFLEEFQDTIDDFF